MFLPSAFTNGFPFTNERTQPSTDNVQSVATEILENGEQNEEKKHEETGVCKVELVDKKKEQNEKRERDTMKCSNN